VDTIGTSKDIIIDVRDLFVHGAFAIHTLQYISRAVDDSTAGLLPPTEHLHRSKYGLEAQNTGVFLQGCPDCNSFQG